VNFKMEDFSTEENVGNSIYALKTSAGQERNVARMLAGKARDSGVDLTAIIVPESLKGYILVESSTRIDMKNPAMKVPHLRGLVESKGTANQDNTISFEEVKKFLNPEPIISSIMKGSIVELVSGPFKGERAKIMRIDESREEVVLELVEQPVAIPITVEADQIRIIQKEAD
jgi:transcriptional antiterminator NusG